MARTQRLKPSLTKGLMMFPVEAFQATLGKATEIFQQLGVRFHLTGGVTSVLYGEPRMTQDIDIVADNQVLAEQLDRFSNCSTQATSSLIHPPFGGRWSGARCFSYSTGWRLSSLTFIPAS